MDLTRRVVVAFFIVGCLLNGCSTAPDGGKATTLELGGTFNVPGGVTYSLKDDAVSCKTTTVLVQDLKGDDIKIHKVTIPANRPLIVEALYEQVQPKGSCRIAVEFLPADGGGYLLFLNQVGLIFGPRCDVFLREYVPDSKSFVDKAFREVCG